MKIRNNFFNEKEQKIFIYENKKEEFFVVAIPELNWSIQFNYDEDKEKVQTEIVKTLEGKANEEELQVLALRIIQWTGEM